MRLRLSLPGWIALALLAAFTVFITWRAKKLEASIHDRREEPELINHVAPSFELPALDGQKVSLASFHGKKKLVLSFWASWCGPCKTEMPVLREFYQRHRKDSDKFEFLAISIDDEQRDAERFATEMKLPFPVLLDLKSQAADLYGVDAIPALFVVNENGKVTYAHVGFDPALEFVLEQKLGLQTTPNFGGADDGDSSD
jgi:peroxiredoxin